MFVCVIFLIMWSSAEGVEERNYSYNAGALVGQNITIGCRRDGQENVLWKYHAPGADGEHTILFKSEQSITSESDDGLFLLRNETGRFDLLIEAVKQSHAGTYTCVKDKNSTTANSRIELVVILSVPECEVIQSASPEGGGDSISMQCHVNFRGNVAPAMKWRNNKTGQSIVSQMNEKFNQYVKSNITLKINQTNKGDIISCATSVNQSSNYDGDATKYEHLWTSLPIGEIVKKSDLNSFTASSSEYTGNLETVSSSMSNGNDESSVDSLTMLLAFIVVSAAVLTVVIVICIVVRKRNSKENVDAAERIFYEDQTGVSQPRRIRTASGAVRIFYEDPTGPLDAEDLDNIYSEDPLTQQNDENHQSQDFRINSVGSSNRIGGNGGGGGGGGHAYNYVDMDLLRDSRPAETIADSPLYADTATSYQELGNPGSPAQNVESDGIVYMEMKKRGSADVISSSSQSRDRMHPLFNRSVYAAIDHTV